MEKLTFKINSAENIVRLCTTILVENDERELNRIGYVWHKLLDTPTGEKIFRKFMEEVLPSGGVIGEAELNAIKDKAIHYLDTDEVALETQANFDKKKYSSWVYFKPYHRVYPVGFCCHYDKVQELLMKYFMGIEDYNVEKFKNFIRRNFEICSENTTVETITSNAENILRTIILCGR